MSYNFTDGAANIRSQNPHVPHNPQNQHNPHNPHNPHNIHNPHDPRNRPGNAPPSSTMSPAHLAIPPDQQHLQMLPQLQHHHPHAHQHHPQHHQQDPYGGFVQPPPPMAISPVNPRKRRLSDDNTMPGSMPVLSAAPQSAYPDHETFMQGHHVQPEQPAIPMPAPPPKKSRVNTPWTPAEEHRLKSMRDAGNSWSEIAKSFPNRTEGSVKKHWYKDMHYAEFAEDEVSRSSAGRANIAQQDPEAQQSAALLNAIKEYEASKWKVIGQKVGKPAKACEQYAKEHFTKDQLGGKG